VAVMGVVMVWLVKIKVGKIVPLRQNGLMDQ
jgi:hypothetical protein